MTITQEVNSATDYCLLSVKFIKTYYNTYLYHATYHFESLLAAAGSGTLEVFHKSKINLSGSQKA